MIDLKLKTFLRAGRLGSITKAAESLGLSQPAVTQQIHSLEDELGCPLFQKKGRGLCLTQAGQFLLDEGEKLYNRSENLNRELRQFKNGQRLYKIGATMTIGEFIIPAYLGGFKFQNPEYDLELVIGNTEAIVGQMKKEMLDLAIVEGPFDKDLWQNSLFMRDELVFTAAPASPWSRIKSIKREEITTIPLLLREAGSGTRQHLEKYLQARRIHPDSLNIKMEMGSLGAIKALCEAGVGCTVISKETIKKELALGTLITIPFEWEPLYRDLRFLYGENSPQSFIETFTSYCIR